jgi:hypothetical protein
LCSSFRGRRDHEYHDHQYNDHHPVFATFVVWRFSLGSGGSPGLRYSIRFTSSLFSQEKKLLWCLWCRKCYFRSKTSSFEKKNEA